MEQIRKEHLPKNLTIPLELAVRNFFGSSISVGPVLASAVILFPEFSLRFKSISIPSFLNRLIQSWMLFGGSPIRFSIAEVSIAPSTKSLRDRLELGRFTQLAFPNETAE